VAGDPDLIAALKRYRPNVGVAPPRLHPARRGSGPGPTRPTSRRSATSNRAKRDVLGPALEAAGLRHAGGDATFFLWLADAEAAAAELLELGLVLAPGSYFGPAGAGYARLALVPTLEECERAAQLISRWRAASR
jgi:acetylornithine aminotransferase